MAGLLRRGLVEEGLAADVARTGDDALWMAAATDTTRSSRRDAAGPDGFDVCRRLREAGRGRPC